MARSVTVLPAEPAAGPRARRFVKEHATLDSMRLTEACLLVTELVTNVVEHSDAAEMTLTVEQEPLSGLRVSVSHAHSEDLDPSIRGMGLTLLERVALAWGHDFDGRCLTVWFELRAPGTSQISEEMPDGQLLERLDENPSGYSAELLRRHQDLAVSISRRYRNKGVPDEDLQQVALMALLKAIRRFDPGLGDDIRRYAAVTISGEMKKLLRDQAWSVRVPRSVQELSLEVTRASQQLGQELNRSPTSDEIADHLGIDRQEVDEALRAGKAYVSRSLETPPRRTGASLAERLQSTDPHLARAEARMTLEEAISKLPERQQRILDLRYNEDMTQSQIAEVVGVSQMHVSRLLNEAIKAIRAQVGEEL